MTIFKLVRDSVTIDSFQLIQVFSEAYPVTTSPRNRRPHRPATHPGALAAEPVQWPPTSPPQSSSSGAAHAWPCTRGGGAVVDVIPRVSRYPLRSWGPMIAIASESMREGSQFPTPLGDC